VKPSAQKPGPLLLDVAPARGTARFAALHPTIGWSVGKGPTATSLQFVVGRDDKAGGCRYRTPTLTDSENPV